MLLLCLAFPPALDAQDPELPEYTTEQRWQRVDQMAMLGLIAGIRLARDQGEDLESYARRWAALFAPGWGPYGGGEPLGVFRSMRRNLLISPGAEVELLEYDDDHVLYRHARPYAAFFGDRGSLYGVSIEEYDRVSEVFVEVIADRLGLDHTMTRQGDDYVVRLERRDPREIAEARHRRLLPAPVDATPVTGRWAGHYDCGIRYDIVLELEGSSSGEVTGVFREENELGRSAYRVVGGANENEALRLEFLEWIDRPEGWISIDMDGTLDLDRRRYTGQMLHPSCGGFEVTRM